MSVEGRISVDVVFHDTDGTNAINVVSLQDSTEYTTGGVAFLTGTAGAGQTSIAFDGVYRNAEGNLVSITEPSRVVFSWSGAVGRRLQVIDFDDSAFCTLVSRSNQIAVCNGTSLQELRLTASSQNTGTYTIILYNE